MAIKAKKIPKDTQHGFGVNRLLQILLSIVILLHHNKTQQKNTQEVVSNMQNTVLKTLFLALLSFASAGAFVVPSQHATRTTTNIINNNNNIQLQATKQPQEMIPAHVKAAAFATLVIISQPLLALAEDDYEYGGTFFPEDIIICQCF